MINIVTLIGNTGISVDSKRLENGTSVANVTLATSESWTDDKGELQTETQWHRLIFWRKQAELAEKFLSEKGKLIFVKGKISYRKYVDKEGIERQSTDIVVESFKMLGKKESSLSSDSFPTDEPKAGTKQETNNDDIFDTKKALEMYEVIEGEQKGKIVTVLNQDEKGVHFLLDRKELFMSHAKFSEFHKKMSPYTPEDLNQKNKPVLVGVDDDDLPF